MNLKALMAGVALAAAAASANATITVRTFDISGSDFNLIFGDGSVAPVDPFHLNITIDLDDTQVVTGATTGFTVNSFNLPDPVQISYNSSLLTIASNAVSNGCNNPPSTFCTFLFDPFGAPSVALVQQSTSSGGYWTASSKSVQVSDGGGVPEPAAWALMIAGFGAVGVALRHRRARLAHT